MSEQEVTYTELKFHTPSKQERIQRPKTIKNKDPSVSAPPWRIIAVILGIFCLVSLGAVVALVAKFAHHVSCSLHADERNFIKSLTHTCHWIGLSHKTANEPWVWKDGTALSSDL
ncbi:killer cell lectin-like receptor 2 [Chelonoidis abingdonii]|uniref:killer cell lectin-like receptor 2 n=1 Tax=Chelonoidis abingdonii TaxID=106734 RepID=UPI0013F2AD2F|nr:killer cell lectin-like receptor 2 [Chelonoidis abingdonii]